MPHITVRHSDDFRQMSRRSFVGARRQSPVPTGSSWSGVRRTGWSARLHDLRSGPTAPSPRLRHNHRVDDLQVPPGPGVPRGLRVPAGELVEQFSHASGPGGQGVNTADSRVQLALDLGTTTALSDAQRELVLDRLSGRLSGTVLTVSAAEHRSQRRNRTAARQRLAALLRDALVPAPVRRPTRPTTGSRRRRIEGKRRRSETKQNRRRPQPE